ncbi:MAG: acyl-CoA dehydrogenase family protein [Desulfovibrionaceae bacterium]|jgi:alkylation response protein AidB-like acyl-CoA dehydrogenase|nr:acyl-CoA dehydrogenase family protein [Desulfovibrionaceae bacterium]
MNAILKLRLSDPPAGADLVAPDCQGLNFWRIDHTIRQLLGLYLEPEVLAHFEPHLDELGHLCGNRMNELAKLADKHGPMLHYRDRFGRNEDWVEYHPAYQEMERIAYERYGMHAMSRREGVLGWPGIVPSVVKYAFNYLFAQTEFGLLCPVSATDTSILLIQNYASEELKRRFLPAMLTQDMDKLSRGAQFMTEAAGGSDVSNSTLMAKRAGDHWELWGDKWFCSCVDHEVVLLLARCEGAPAGNGGLSLFLMPRWLEDGARNRYRIARLKDKLGSRSMASGETTMEGAVAYLLGEPGRGLRQIMDQTNLCRLSHGFRAAGMMRRCMNEALQVARNRMTFRKFVIEHPLARRQLLKMLLPTEQALSVGLAAAMALDAGNDSLVRILTPLVKLRSCRDNVKVATASMEMRGGNGYIEDWTNARLVRDAHLGVLWEGTSSINALDLYKRAVGKEQAHHALHRFLHSRLDAAPVPMDFAAELRSLVDAAIRHIGATAADTAQELTAREAITQLYHVTSAVLMACEGAQLGARGGDARRLLMARLVIDHRLMPAQPFQQQDVAREHARFECLLGDAATTRIDDVAALLK